MSINFGLVMLKSADEGIYEQGRFHRGWSGYKGRGGPCGQFLIAKI